MCVQEEEGGGRMHCTAITMVPSTSKMSSEKSSDSEACCLTFSLELVPLQICDL